MIKFACENCGRKIAAQDKLAGKRVKCPRCGNVILAPTADEPASFTSQSNLTDVNAKRENPNPDLSLLDIPDEYKTENQPLSQDVLSGRTSEDAEELAETEQTGQRRLPWLIDAFLYPLNLAGIIHLICLWLLVFLLCPLVMGFLGLGTEYIPVVYTLPVAYVLYYFTECIRDSATGHFRAPDYWKHPNEDKWDVISQLLIVLGCIAVCFCPALAYYSVTKRTDLIYWLLLTCGGFFFPMALLGVVLFDSYSALNPILIVGSIFRTFFPYCGTVLFFCGAALLFIKMDARLYSFRLLPTVPFVLRAVQLYLMFVAAGFLGRFYWRHKDKLDWGL
jgi:DNA-directed RNA polymerase subunit RPC12/RpoP